MIEPGSWIYDSATGRMVPKDEYLRQKYSAYAKNRSGLSFPHVISDTMPEITSMADGRNYTSKSAYYKSVSKAGCEIVGYDKNWTDHIAKPIDEKAYEADIIHDIKKSIEEVASK